MIIATVNVQGNQKDAKHLDIIPTTLPYPKKDLSNVTIAAQSP
jgi:hypothetical protein